MTEHSVQYGDLLGTINYGVKNRYTFAINSEEIMRVRHDNVAVVWMPYMKEGEVALWTPPVKGLVFAGRGTSQEKLDEAAKRALEANK